MKAATGNKADAANASVALVHKLHRASQVAEECLESELVLAGLGGLTSRQLLVIQALARAGACNQVELTRMTGIDRSTLAELIQRLKTKELINRRRSKLDARAQVVRISDKGAVMLEKATAAIERAQDRFLAKMPAETADDLRNALDVIWRGTLNARWQQKND